MSTAQTLRAARTNLRHWLFGRSTASAAQRCTQHGSWQPKGLPSTVFLLPEVHLPLPVGAPCDTWNPEASCDMHVCMLHPCCAARRAATQKHLQQAEKKNLASCGSLSFAQLHAKTAQALTRRLTNAYRMQDVLQLTNCFFAVSTLQVLIANRMFLTAVPLSENRTITF